MKITILRLVSGKLSLIFLFFVYSNRCCLTILAFTFSLNFLLLFLFTLFWNVPLL